MITKYMVEIDRLREIMKSDNIEIAANFAKTNALIEETKTMRAEDEAKRI